MALLNLVRVAEQGAAVRLMADGARYRSGGCTIADLAGRRVGECSGAALKNGDTVKMRVYVVVGAKRAIVTLSITGSIGSESKDEVEGIVAQLTP